MKLLILIFAFSFFSIAKVNFALAQDTTTESASAEEADDFEDDDFDEDDEDDFDEDEDFAEEEAGDDLDEELEKEKETAVKTKDKEIDQEEEADETPAPKRVAPPADSFKELAGKDMAELSFMHAATYDAFTDEYGGFNLYFDYGFQTSSMETKFASEATIPLPEDYTMFGLEINYSSDKSPWLFGFRYNQLSSDVSDDTFKISYSLSLGTIYAAYQLSDSYVMVAPHVGYVMGLAGSAEATTIATSDSTSSDFALGASFAYGIMAIVKLKAFHIGMDGGMFLLNGQKLNEEEFSKNSGGYVRTIFGMSL